MKWRERERKKKSISSCRSLLTNALCLPQYRGKRPFIARDNGKVIRALVALIVFHLLLLLLPTLLALLKCRPSTELDRNRCEHKNGFDTRTPTDMTPFLSLEIFTSLALHAQNGIDMISSQKIVLCTGLNLVCNFVQYFFLVALP